MCSAAAARVKFRWSANSAALPTGDADTVFLGGTLDEALASPATDGAIDTLVRLVPLFQSAWVISKCGERTLAWLDHHDFYDRTGISRRNVRFCRRRADKAVHCRKLGITHMIDDRIDVHRALEDVVPHRYLFGHQSGPAPAEVRHTRTWAELEEAITADIPAARR